MTNIDRMKFMFDVLKVDVEKSRNSIFYVVSYGIILYSTISRA